MSFTLWVAVTVLAQHPGGNPADVYDATVDSVFGVRASVLGGEHSGSGVVLTKDGLALVSYAVVPAAATRVRVWMKGPRRYDADIVATSRRDEATLIRIKAGRELKPITLGDSSAVRAGDVAYTIGNSARSIIDNDQPSFNVGIVSGTYVLDAPRANAEYVGLVLETTAAVNVGMEGAPLLDRSGRMIGFVTLNYSPHRFLGCAIPADTLKPVLRRLQEEAMPPDGAARPSDDGPARPWLGARVVDRDGDVVVESVEPESPAEAAGLRKGIVILRAGRRAFRSAKDFEAYVEALEPEALLLLTVEDEGLETELRILVGRKRR